MVCLYLSTERWSPLSALIRFNTRCEYSHVGFKDGDWYFSAQLNGGVRYRSRFCVGPAKEKMTSELLLTAPGIEEAYQWAKTQASKPYDWGAILGLATDRNWRNDDRWFCSELIAKSFEQVGHPLLNPAIVSWRITPRDILLSEHVTRVNP